nr:hypothetical protein CFP56_72553 [Quercus suber]
MHFVRALLPCLVWRSPRIGEQEPNEPNQSIDTNRSGVSGVSECASSHSDSQALAQYTIRRYCRSTRRARMQHSELANDLQMEEMFRVGYSQAVYYAFPSSRSARWNQLCEVLLTQEPGNIDVEEGNSVELETILRPSTRYVGAVGMTFVAKQSHVHSLESTTGPRFGG